MAPITLRSTDASCVCTDTTYQAAVLQCLQSSCTPADVTEAEGVQAALCGGCTSSLLSLISCVDFDP